MSEAKRAAIYVRVSTGRQELEGTSLDTQAERSRAYCAERGYQLVAVYSERHTAAELWQRPVLAEVRKAARERQYDVLVCYALDRLSRNQAHVYIIAEELYNAGVALEFVTESFEDSAVGRFIRSAKAFAAEVEREKTTERTARGRLARAQGGKPSSGPRVCYGYRWADEAHTRYEPDPPRAAIVERVFRDAVAGVPLRNIARALTAEGIPSPAGGVWCHDSVRYILRTGYYGGRAFAFRIKTRKVNGHYHHERVPEDEQVPLPEGVVPPIVDAETYAAAQIRLARNKTDAARHNPNPEAYLLRAGIARCGVCGVAMSASAPKGRHRETYRCPGDGETPHNGAVRPSIVAAVLDGAVWERVRAILTQPETIAAELGRLEESDPTSADLAAVDRTLLAIARKRATLARRVAQIDDDEAAAPLLAELVALANQKRAQEAERANVLARQSDWQRARRQLGTLQEWCRQVAHGLDSFGYAEKRLALLALGVEVKVYPTGQEPRYTIAASIPLHDDIVTSTP